MVTKTKKEKVANGCLLSYMDYLAKEKYASGKNGTAAIYTATRNQLASFISKDQLSIKRVNTQLVNDFIDHLQSLSLSRNSVSCYISTFRSAYNSAVSNHLVVPNENPFLKLRLRPVPSYKRSIGTDVIKEMMQINLDKNKRLDFARDLFLFCFMACGMTFVDLAHLTKKHLHGNRLIYYRIKTKTEISITITPGMRYLLEKYSDANSDLLFPILKSVDASYETYK